MIMSHYVIMDLIRAIDQGDTGILLRMISKCTKRYKSDEEVLAVLSEMESSIVDKKFDARAGEFKGRLEVILQGRKLSSSGGTNLWFSDCRSSANR